MRLFSPLSSALVAAALLALTACAGRQPPPPDPSIVDHPVHTPTVVTMMMMDREARALRDSTIVRMVRAGVEEWNQGNLDAFLAVYDSGATYESRDGVLVDARDAVRRIHAARRIGGGDTRLSIRLLRAETVADDVRRLVITWIVADAVGRREAWTSSPTFRLMPGVGWRIIREQLLPDEMADGGPGTR